MPDPITPESAKGSNAAEVILNSEEVEKHTITVDGKDQELTIEELKAAAQKGASADERFRSADALRKAAEADSKTATYHRAMQETIKRAKTPGPDQAQGLRDMANNYPEFGISKEDAEIVIQNIANKEAEVVAEPEKKEDALAAATPATPPVFEELPERVQKSVEAQEEAVRQSNLSQARASMKAALDSDEVVGRILHGPRKATRSKRLLDYAMTILSQKVAQAGRYTPDTVRAAVEETRAFTKDVGLLDVDPQVPGSPLGLGRSPTTPFGSLAKSGSPPPQIDAKDALDTERYASNVLDRLLHQAQVDNDE